MTFKVLDLFCGAGGLSLGFEMAKFEISAGIEIEKDFLKSYKNAHPNSKAILEDLSKDQIKNILSKNDLFKEDIDVVIGGPPCQGFSTAGNRMIKDPRNALVKQYANVIKEVKPQMFLMENVSGLATMKNGVGELVSDELMSLFHEIGYSTVSKILLSANYGVPQLRKRLFFVGIRNDLDEVFSWPKPSHFPKNSLMSFGDNDNYLTVWEAISDLPTLQVGEKKDCYDSSYSNDYQMWARDGSEKLYNHRCPKHSELVLERISNISQGENHSNLPDHLKLKSGYPNIYGRLSQNFPADTITGNCGCASAPGKFIHPTQDRVISVREGARLQSFPDRIEFFGSLTKQYKQVGNAVPTLMAKAVAESMKTILKAAN